MYDEYNRRHPVKDEQLLSWFYSQLEQKGLLGSIFSRPE